MFKTTVYRFFLNLFILDPSLFEHEYKFVSFDVESLFTNIQHVKTIRIEVIEGKI